MFYFEFHSLPEMSSLELNQLSDITAVASLRHEWSQLWRECPGAVPFQLPEWLLPWWNHLGGGELRVITLRNAGKLVGMVPLFLHQWQGRRQISPLGVSFSDYTDILLLPDFARRGAELIVHHLAESREEWEVCILPDLTAGSPLLKTAIPASLSPRIQPSSVCPVVTLPGTVEEYRSTLPSHRRRDLSRGWRLFEKAAGAQIEKADATTLPEFMDALFLWHTERWQKQGQPGVLASEALRAFNREAAGGLQAQGVLRLYGLRFQGTLRSVVYGMRCGDRAYAYLSALDPSLTRQGAGHLVMFHAIQEAIREGCREFDLLRGQETYKYEWGARDRQNYSLTLNAGS